jgi:PQQ-dependent catabolism-associated CXXCW motif protein
MSIEIRGRARAFAGIALLIVATGAAATPGTIIAEGGGASSRESIQRFASLVGGEKQVCYITTANPGVSSEGRWLRPFGLSTKAVRVTADNADSRAMADELSKCDAVYFDGGLPRLLSEAFIRNGHDTLALATIRKRHNEGMPLGGSSAGAMIMGPFTLCACGMQVSMKVLGGQPPEISPAFGFVSVPIDAHSFVFNEYGREMVAMARQKWTKMLVLDESAAVEIPGDGSPWRVLGPNAVGLLHAPDHAAPPYTDYDFSVLRGGDMIDPQTLEAVTTGRKLAEQPHRGLSEGLQAPPGVLLYMVNSINAGTADAFGWDAFWSPENPWRIRLAWGANSAAYENANPTEKRSNLVTHLSLSVGQFGRQDYSDAVTTTLERRYQRDWGVSSIDGVRKDCVYYAPTPTAAPGVTVVDSDAVKSKAGLLINALPPDTAGQTRTIPGSVWLGSAGLCGTTGDAVEAQLAARLQKLTDGDRSKTITFFCATAACWYSYNAAQRARHLGYSHVNWYRGGLEAWEWHGGEVSTTGKNEW